MRVKPLLRNSRFIAGIGNAYSDEILWEARWHRSVGELNSAQRTSIALYDAMRSVLAEPSSAVRVLVPPNIEPSTRVPEGHLRAASRARAAVASCARSVAGSATTFCRRASRRLSATSAGSRAPGRTMISLGSSIRSPLDGLDRRTDCCAIDQRVALQWTA